ncbi:SMP-30/gluconolactonase/LRE family protein [Novosphingobium piscinae]|uniref:SMP-30/gluconolactonase/LRE family protein n=1 Tax=Novosphingobium piscinae TaxID=1507448 RepID=A0A7X1KNT4_9SPHN|nr:SMP-30/gluconolactonase/LRE family protein [Novosphingobium piscinae]MBC2667768.1 SMP-30/gluconolactonase/LRE family protein [Novosphingobium piscinae]
MRAVPLLKGPAVLACLLLSAAGAGHAQPAASATSGPVTPGIAGVVNAGTPIEVLGEGFDGTEGPLGLPDGAVLFTETRANRIVRIAPDGSLSVYLEQTEGANALALGAKGELFAVLTAPAAIAQLQPVRKVLASGFAGKPFGRTNDLVRSRSGQIYFTDPGATPVPGAATPASPPATGLYWLDRGGQLHLVASDIARPNGVALSPDERTLYVANTAGAAVLAFAVQSDGRLTGRRDFARLAGFRTGPTGPGSGADGIAVDRAGRVFVASNGGIEVFSAKGVALGVIALPKQPQNLAFGGKDRAQLYVVGRGSAYRIATLTRGVDRPGK